MSCEAEAGGRYYGSRGSGAAQGMSLVTERAASHSQRQKSEPSHHQVADLRRFQPRRRSIQAAFKWRRYVRDVA